MDHAVRGLGLDLALLPERPARNLAYIYRHRHQGRPFRQGKGDQGQVALRLASREGRPFRRDQGHKGTVALRAIVKRSQQDMKHEFSEGRRERPFTSIRLVKRVALYAHMRVVSELATASEELRKTVSINKLRI